MNSILLSPRRLRFGVLHASSALLLSAASAALAADRIQSGKWESAMTTDGATRTVSFCVSPEEAAGMNGDSKSGRDFAEKKAGSRCTLKSYDARGDTISYSLVCGSRTIADTTTFHGVTSDGVKTVTSEGVTVKTLLKSRRVGACP